MIQTSPTSEFDIDFRVYYEDTDAGGIVYYANYLRFFERARTEWLRQLGFDQSRLANKEQVLFVVKAVEIQYNKPAKLDDLLTIHNTVSHLGRASIRFRQQVMRNNELLCEGIVTVCCVDASQFRPTPFPNELRTLLDTSEKP